MLSKLQFYELKAPTPEISTDRDLLQMAITRHLRQRDPAVALTPSTGGTLGVCFRARFAGERGFLKTHLPGQQARTNLAKEADILQRLYGRNVVRERLEIPLPKGDSRLCLLMAELAPLPVPMPADTAVDLVCDFTDRLAGYRPADLPPSWDLEHYLASGAEAVTTLSKAGLLENRTSVELNHLLGLLQDTLGRLPRTLCHGDLGPKNLMAYGEGPVAIDWEDAFWGVAGYDYLYWLTFMDNRRHLHSAAFGRTGLPLAVERAILALVVLLKSFLSVRSGAYLQHSVPIGARITEVLELPQRA